MIVQVTREHIARGLGARWYGCPVALALREWTGQTEWIVDGKNAYLWRPYADATGQKPGTQTHALPIRVREFIAAYDAGRPVEPLTFELPDAVEPGACPLGVPLWPLLPQVEWPAEELVTA